MTPRPDLRSTAFAPVAAVVAFFASILIVLIALRLIDHGLAFGRWLAARP